MKSRVTNGCAAKLNRFQNRYRRKSPGAPNLDANIYQLRRSLPCAEFDRECPSWRFRCTAKPGLKVSGVDLNDNAVDFVIQIVAPFFPITTEVNHFIQRMAQLPMRIHFQTQLHDALQVLRLKRHAGMDPVAIKIERPLG